MSIPGVVAGAFDSFVKNYLTTKINYSNTPPQVSQTLANSPNSTQVMSKTPPVSQGNLSQQNNNPGNFIYAGQPGAVKGAPKGDGQYWAKFPDEKTGYQAFQADTEAKLKRNPNMTVAQWLDILSPPSENNSSSLHYNVMDDLKDLKDNGTINTLMANKLLLKDVPIDRAMKAKAKGEGYYATNSPQ